MPRSVVAAGCIDFVLAPKDIAAELARIARHPYVSILDRSTEQIISQKAENNFDRILQLLHETTGVYFSGYKSATVNRRITRRMLLHRIEELSDYIQMLETHGDELQSLCRESSASPLSSVMPRASRPSDRVLPEIFRDRSRTEPVRVWVLGCSSGKEAYSLAITISEFAMERGVTVPVQIFATDLNEHSITKARLSIYSKNIAQDLAAQRLSQFFVELKVATRSRSKYARCVSLRQNVLADPPFSRLDMVSCRNMLIYLEPVFQKRIIPLLHYALRIGGYLWLGSSESITGFSDLFEVIEPQQKIFRRKAGNPVSVAFFAPAFESREFVQRRPHSLESSSMDVQREAGRLAVTKYAPPGCSLTLSSSSAVPWRHQSLPSASLGKTNHQRTKNGARRIVSHSANSALTDFKCSTLRFPSLIFAHPPGGSTRC
jgi:two-component system, chemotaxis family, CheB/CheR fusion protein